MTADAPVTPAGDRQVTLAAIIGAHGVAGEVRLKLFCDGPESLKRYKMFEGGGRVLTLSSIRAGSNGAVARFAEVKDRNGAEALRGVALTVPRSALPPLGEGEFYHCDIIGLPCVSDTGDELGQVVAVENFGAGDIIELERPAEPGAKPKRFMVPIHAARIEAEQAVIDSRFV